MPYTFGGSSSSNTGVWIVGAFVLIAVVVVVSYSLWPSPTQCSHRLHRSSDGVLRLEPSGREFPDMNAFQQWWYASRESVSCPLPVLTGATREVPVMHDESDEQTYAKTPIYKVDDYEFSRVFGNERDGHMDVPRQNFNVILNQRQFDWPDKPLSSDERRSKYKGLHEGFTASGDLKSFVMSEPSAEDLVKEATQKFRPRKRTDKDVEDIEIGDPDMECKLSRETREVASLVAAAYESEPDYEPVITKVGANHWEVNELKPRHRKQQIEGERQDTVVDTGNDAVDIAFEYRERKVIDDAIDPYFSSTGDLPYESAKHSKDPWYGPVPGMERMFGPTFDHEKWY